MGAIFKKEFRSYFTNMIGYIFIAFILVIVGFYCVGVNFQSGYPYFEYSFGSTTFIFLFVIPILTMRSLAEERHSKTDQLLYSLPLSVTDIVLGKYFAMVAIFAIPCAIMCVYPVIMSFYGTVYYITTYSAILAYFLLGCALIALGMFMSSLTESQIISAVLAFGAILICYLFTAISSLIPTSAIASFISLTVIILLFAILVWYMTKNSTITYATGILLEGILFVFYMFNSSAFEGLINNVFSSLSPFDKLDNFIYGMCDISSLFYYLSIIVIFVFLSTQSVEKRRWS